MIPTALLGPPPRPEHYVFLTAATANLVVEMVDIAGRTIGKYTLAVTSTAQTLYQLLGSNWNAKMIGGKVLSASADVYYNTGGDLTADNVASVLVAPTNTSALIPMGTYTSDPYKLGLVA